MRIRHHHVARWPVGLLAAAGTLLVGPLAAAAATGPAASGTAASVPAVSEPAASVPAAAHATTTGTFFTRLSGADLYATAARIATSTFSSASTVVLATGASPYDAGSGNYLAGALHAPVLLTAPGSLPAVTASALATLRTVDVDVVGGPAAVSDAVLSDLQQLGYRVSRIAGADAFATAAEVATELGAGVVGTTGGGERTAIVVTGLGTGDIQAAAPMAYAGPFPILFSDASGLPAASTNALRSLGIRHVMIVGGPLAVPAGVETELAAMDITSQRIAGANQLETAARVANVEVAQLGFGLDHVNVARGDDFADALSGGPNAGSEPSPLLLTASSTTLGGATAAWLANQCPSLTSGDVFGGPLAVSDDLVSEMAALATSCGTSGGTSGGTVPGGGGTATPTSLVLTPESSYAVSGTSATVTATATANGTPVAGAPVDFFVVDESTEGSSPSSGTCTLSAAASPASTGTTACTVDSADPVTNAQGQVSFTFHWATPVGKRPIEGQWAQTVYAFTGPVGTAFDPASTTLAWDEASVIWVNATTSIALQPAAATVHYGDTTAVTATLMSVNDEGVATPVPQPGATIAWRVYREASCTVGATVAPTGTPTLTGSALTDANGTATIAYAYAPDPVPEADTVDCLYAFYDQNGDGTHQSTEPGTTGTVTWSTAAATPSLLTLGPSTSSALAQDGAEQLVTATVTDQYGAAAPGVQVTWSIARGTETVATGTGTTGDDGQVAIADTSPTGSAHDVVTATAPDLPEATADVYWVEAAPSGSYVNATIITSEPTSTSSGYIDVSLAGQYLRLFYDATDVLKVGNRVVQTERFTESLAPGATITADPYSADPAAPSTFTVASTGGGGGHGGGGGM